MAKQYRRGLSTYQTLFGEEEQADAKKKGRDAELLARRDKRLYHRCYYYGKIHGLLLEPLYEALEEDFDLSVETLPRIIDNYTTEIRRLMNENVTVEQLRKMYPKMVWEHPKKG